MLGFNSAATWMGVGERIPHWIAALAMTGMDYDKGFIAKYSAAATLQLRSVG